MIDKKIIKFLVNIIFIICFRYISMLFNFCWIGVLEKEGRRGVRFKGRIREFKFKIRLIRFRSKEI